MATGTATPTKIGEIRKPQTAPAVEAVVQPSELCDMQRRSMGYDAFAALQAKGV